MKTPLTYIPEPMLQFGSDQHPDIRYGIMNFGPCDIQERRRPGEIKVAIVGTPEGISSATRWIDRCRGFIPGESSPKRNLFAPFPGFSKETRFESECVLDGSMNSEVKAEKITDLSTLPQFNDRVSAAVDLFLEHLASTLKKKPDVIVLAMPLELLSLLGEDAAGEPGAEAAAPLSSRARRRGKFNFHDMLKARALGLGVPVQLARPSTFDRSVLRKEKDDFARSRHMQDEATCAWNFFVALYYKAGGYSWRLVRDPAELKTCFVGISFYEALDRSKLQTSVAQVFDERGHGLLVQGGVVQRDAVDRQPRMDETGAYSLLKEAMESYKGEHGHLPARVVVHKSSTFNDAEKSGATRALREMDIFRYDLLSVSESWIRLVRNAYYPPLRGTFWQMDDARALLYTNGSVQQYEEYPGLWVPRSVLINYGQCQTDRQQLASEILTLTKMNWNNSQITAIEPITIRAARQVGRIIKYSSVKQKNIPYWFFM
jgi:hypothetical protein